MTNNQALFKENNAVYRSQFSIFVFITAFTFKVVMLPQYLAHEAGNLAFVSMAIMMLINVIMYMLVYYVTTHINFMKHTNKYIVAPIMALIFIVSISRFSVLATETSGYISSTLFDQGKISFILLTLFPVLFYIVHKGGNTIARMAQIIMIIAGLAIAVSLILLRTNLDFGALLPFNISFDGVLKGCDMHYFWFGDYLPLLFFNVVECKRGKEHKSLFPITLIIVFLGSVGMMMLFTVIYGDASAFVAFAFNKIAVFNRITELIGATNFPIIIAWLLMAIIKLALLLYSCSMSLAYFVRNKNIASAIAIITIGLIIAFVMPNIDKAYFFATSNFRYFIAAAQYAIPIILATYVFVLQKKAANSPQLRATMSGVATHGDKTNFEHNDIKINLPPENAPTEEPPPDSDANTANMESTNEVKDD